MHKHLCSVGQSQIEFLVALAFLIPFAILLPTLANMLLLQTEAHKAARHAAWERTAYATGDLKTGEELSEEVEDRFLRFSQTGFGDTSTAVTETQWRDWKTLNNMVEYERDVAMRVDASRSATAGHLNTSAWLAGRGGRNDAANAVELDTLQSTQLSIPLREDISLLTVTRPVNAWISEPDPVNQPEMPVDDIRGGAGYHLKSSSALVADGWVPGNEVAFHDRVYDIGRSTRSFLPFYQNSPATRALSGIFVELREDLFVDTPGTNSAFDMVDPSQSVTLPAYLTE